MQKPVVFNHVTLDGYFAGENGDFSWARPGNGEPRHLGRTTAFYWLSLASTNASGRSAAGGAPHSFWRACQSRRQDPRGVSRRQTNS
jgi:hypothetical protein